MGFIDEIKARAKADKKTIVLPETEDARTYKAAETVLKEGIADLILIGKKEDIEKNKGAYDISGAQIVDPATNDKTEAYIAKLVELRQKKRNDRRAGERTAYEQLHILWCYDGEDGRR